MPASSSQVEKVAQIVGAVRIPLDQVVAGPGDGALVGAAEVAARQRGPGATPYVW
jgi:hypothetical protein